MREYVSAGLWIVLAREHSVRRSPADADGNLRMSAGGGGYTQAPPGIYSVTHLLMTELVPVAGESLGQASVGVALGDDPDL